MEIVGAVASIITLVALAKEISALADILVRNVQNGPDELSHISNQISLVSLELDLLRRLEDEKDDGPLLTNEEAWILKQSLTIANHDIAAMHREYQKLAQSRFRKGSRLSWAQFDSKTSSNALKQLHRTEGHLLLVLQVINMYALSEEVSMA